MAQQIRILDSTLRIPDGAIIDSMISQATGSQPPIQAGKLEHKYKPSTDFGNAVGEGPTAREEIVFVAHNSGQVTKVRALLNVTGSAGSIQVDCKRNGASILAAPIDVTSGNADGEVIDGVLSSPGVSAGDILTLELTVVGSNGNGPFAWVEVNELA